VTAGRANGRQGPRFEPGLQLAADFYHEVVQPLLVGTPHSAARLGEGSDVLGFDTERSTDHGWGPRLQVFVREADVEDVRAAVEAGLPERFRGWPVRFGWDDVPVTHHVEIDTPERWLTRHLGFDPTTTIGLLDWLATPQQLLLQVTAGRVFHDELGVLVRVRGALAWYPDELWRWLLGSQWTRIGQEEAFVGRAEEVGDELGSRVVTARLARELVRLCFLIERRYAPYSKWLGSAFGQLEAARDVGPALIRALSAEEPADREQALLDAYAAAAARHNDLGVTQSLDATPRAFHERPYRVLGAERFAEACFATVHDPKLRSMPPIGAIDQWGDSTDLATPDGARAARALLSSWW
jgi:hypothetical protein